MNNLPLQLKKYFLFLITFLGITTFTYSHNLSDCTAKKRNIEIQLKYAMLRGNKNEINSLEQALTNNTRNCNEKNLQTEREQKKQKKLEKIKENQKKVKQLKIKLKQELKFGNQNKILKKQHKLDKAEKELKEAKDRINS